jgi:hypothetical protein
MYDGTSFEVDLPYDLKGRSLKKILNEREMAFFEAKLRKDLDFNKRTDNFWHTFKVHVIKDDNLMLNGIEFDLSDPMDNLRWRVLKVHPWIAPSWDDRYESGEYKFALVEAGYQDRTKATKAEKMRKAYQYLGRLQGSRVKMSDFLHVYWLGKPRSKRPDPEAPTDVLIGMIQQIIEDDLDGLLAIESDVNYDAKIFIYKAMSAGYVTREGIAGNFLLEGRYLGRTLPEASVNIVTPEWNEDYLRIKTYLGEHKTSAMVNKKDGESLTNNKDNE